MPRDERSLIEVLKFELDFIEKGGYGRSGRTPRFVTSMFKDSLTCLNFGDSHRTHPCQDCILMPLVPPERRGERVPCHHIPLNETGGTVDTFEQRANQQDLEEAVKNWLREKIRQLEQERTEERLHLRPSGFNGPEKPR